MAGLGQDIETFTGKLHLVLFVGRHLTSTKREHEACEQISVKPPFLTIS
jgi:hypothetical protein